MNQLFEDVIRCFFPIHCGVCQKAIQSRSSIFCLSCWENLPKADYNDFESNATTEKFLGKVKLTYGFSYLFFHNNGIAQKLIHKIKYRNQQKLGQALGKLLAMNFKANANGLKPFELIVPVPLHKDREMSRGYNQSEALAIGMASEMQIPISTQNLLRTLSTETQTAKSRIERFQNVRNAFAVDRPEEFENKHILLVDDVLTTGATLEACALQMESIPGIRISVATLGLATWF